MKGGGGGESPGRNCDARGLEVQGIKCVGKFPVRWEISAIKTNGPAAELRVYVLLRVAIKDRE